MSGFAREIRAHEFREMQIDFARLVGLEYPDEARQRSWAHRNFRVICSQLYEQKFFPHQYFEYHDWMDFSQMELRKDLMSRYKLLEVLEICYSQLLQRYGAEKTSLAVPQWLEKTTQESTYRLVFCLPSDVQSFSQLWEPKKELTIRKRTDHPTPEWDRRSSVEASSSRVEDWARFARAEEGSHNDRMREMWDTGDEADTERDNDWDLLKDWNVEEL
ncbi:hypothetical protein W97_02732 [Coniosporium apollinis CBS 100218]|uniref:Uncharacterized protein n=1 Tax=Coniosporium apollinis (strain CBS 100218) TaxID=1168221 RepID=R7YNV8_CONA1|nr:uncharacterized protein W97_02732 [Coniosporium apollinis CBS 100218]EON63504.1 hypothetical protein W97_02732 [Coniosporium apollinis CBS 100218]